jgi:hypothetical protein
MSDRSPDDRLDREIRDFLAWETGRTVDGPDATEMVRRLSGGVGAPSVRSRAPRLVWLLLLGMLITLLAGAAIGGASLLQDDGPSFEAVFLRFDEGRPSELVVLGIDAEGRERRIARLEDARVPTWPVPLGVVSPSGLLAVPRPLERSPDSDYDLVSWEIIDLHRPDTESIVIDSITQDLDQLRRTPYYEPSGRPSVSWGPGDRFLLPWRERRSGPATRYLTFVDGRTGAIATVDYPVDDELLVLPAWAPDGSGILIGRWCDDTGCDIRNAKPIGILRPDGTMVEGPVTIAPDSSSRRYRGDGEMVTVADSGVRVEHDGTFEPLAPDGEITDVAWTAEGDGFWLAVRPSSGEQDLRIERAVSPSDLQLMGTVDETDTYPPGSRVQGHFVGLAPDDSMLAVSLDRETGSEGNGSTHPVPAAALVVPATGESFEIEGSFAGWMEVER